MAKRKEARTPVKGEKPSRAPKASVTARGKPLHLSEELVQESESHGDSDTSGGDPDTESEDDKRQNKRRPRPEHVKVSEPNEPAVPDDESEEDDEEDDSEDASVDHDDDDAAGATGVPAAPPKLGKDAPRINGVKRKADAEEASDDEAGGDDRDEIHRSKKARRKGTDESSSPKDDNDSDEDDGEEDVKELTELLTTTSRAQRTASPPPTLAPVPPRQFDPPTGYEPMSLNGTTLLSASDLQGKQLWHITAPAGVPLSAVSSVSLEALQSQATMLTHRSTDYMLTEDHTRSTSVFLPGEDGYTPVSHPIEHSLTLCPKLDLPSIASRPRSSAPGSQTAATVALAAVTSVRPQPKGLRMHYRPPGFGDGNPGVIGGVSSDEDEGPGSSEQHQSAFQFPRSVGPHQDGDGVLRNDSGRKQKQKDKKRPAAPQRAPNGIGKQFEPIPNPSAANTEALELVAENVATSGKSTATDGKELTKEERRRRKEEKRARKEAKRKSLAA